MQARTRQANAYSQKNEAKPYKRRMVCSDRGVMEQRGEDIETSVYGSS